ncbi:type I-F CRISPR-associated helicase Cas3f [Azomonas macrocytogenes]|uniref:CRISPR-associated endonuclease/helicase Cas3 n=1 Tax=Azomonas macrocytogenes TaxID=69962 RepID=A0A839T1D8_AZOMA|nr:type I-F CRISPR-associated helicase Cas3f [Azomonas macrocytogenes]MBB3102789.1 CRISPR-associated endonuclease/helicase Cas3 [Azomonas macrocytogenes]
MNILLIAQCDKRALTESRRILDQFTERRGERTWQTPITQAGLDTLRKLLRKTARKNTAVACHWIRGKDHSELLWIVGDASRFNAQGATPTNTTRRNVLRREDENDWHSLQIIRALAALAALLHDLGKACLAFQDRLRSDAPLERNLYRHEWISLRLFQAFVGDSDDAQWLQRLSDPSAADNASWLDRQRLRRDGLDPAAPGDKPFARLPPLARALGWLVLSHHRLPMLPAEDDKGGYRPQGVKVSDFRSEQLVGLLERIDATWNEPHNSTDTQAIEAYWRFPHGLPVTTREWRKQASRLARRLLELSGQLHPRPWLDDPYVMHLSRLALMLADHHYSSLTDPSDRPQRNADYPLHANTCRDASGRPRLNQTLDEHLLGVEAHASLVAHALPGFERHLPRLARHKGLKKRSADPRFRWQDRAADTATAMRERAARQGAFLVNMASTGCGKTLANARIMNALADPAKGLRCAFALGLRTLTLQTGRAFRETLGLGDDELAIRVGGAASRELFEHYQQLAERSGSASCQELLEENGHVLFEGNDQHPLLQRLSRDPQVRALLATPLLVCTIDHLTPATESQRGGHQIAPMLRLMSGDLVLDEPDDFDIDDLPALTRLVHWAGLLGSRVLLSSATLPPALVEGLFLAYRNGRQWFQRNRGERPGETPNICCAWFDEFNQAGQDCTDAETFRNAHQAFARKRHERLSQEAVRRRSQLLPLDFTTQDKAERRCQFALQIRDAALSLHAHHHSIDPHSGKRVSFGLVRMANIDPLFDVALALYRHGAPAGWRIHLCVYHSQFPLLIRSAIEQRLDAALNRRQPEAVFELPDIRQRLDHDDEPDHLFIVLGSPVTEVGRDHDYDWAVVEPSSMRSLIQLAGRIRRHRSGAVEQPNLVILDSNLRYFEQPGKAAFCKPGFERDEGDFRLTAHRLEQLLDAQERQVIDARPRILPRTEADLRPRERLVDLEHARLHQQMLPPAMSAPATAHRARFAAKAPSAPLNAASHWLHEHLWLTGVLAQQQPFRYDPQPRLDLVLLPNDDEDDYALHRLVDGKCKGETLYVKVENSLNYRAPPEAVQGERIAPWSEVDFMQALTEQATALDMPLLDCARRFATVSLPNATQGWRFHPVLGFTKEK